LGTLCENDHAVIIDFHTHIFAPEIIENKGRYLERDAWFASLYGGSKAKMAAAEDLIASMDEAGVDRSVALGFAWADQGLCAETNDYIIEATKRYPGHLIGFACVQPRASKAVYEVERCAAEGLRGIGELSPDGQGYALDDERVMAPVVEAAIALGLPVLVHASEPVGHIYPGKGTVTPDVIYRFVRGCPELPLICAHWGGGLPFYELMPEVAEACANVYYDTAASPYLYRDEVFPLVAEVVGHKILFGSDYPLIGQKRLLDRIRDAGLPRDVLAKLLGENAERLFGMQGR